MALSLDESHIRLHLIGTLISGVLYGLLVSLFLHTLVLLITSKKHTYSNRTRYFLIAYIVIMFLLSSVAIIQAFVFVTKAMIHGVDPTSKSFVEMNEPFTLPLAVSGADGFMLWRCIMLYANASKFHRRLVYAALTLSALASLVCGFFYYLCGHATPCELPLLSTTMSISVTAGVNFVLTALIAGRLWTHQEGMRRILGPHYGSPYMRLILAIIESCCLIVINALVYIIVYALGSDKKAFGGSIIPLLSMPHICALSPILIVYHVARGRAATTVKLSDIVTPNLRDADIGGEWKPKSIQFNHDSPPTIDSTRPLSRRHSLSNPSTSSRSSRALSVDV